MRLDVEVAELPDDGVDVSLLVVDFGLLNQLLPLELVQLTTLLQLFHHLEYDHRKEDDEQRREDTASPGRASQPYVPGTEPSVLRCTR